MNLVVDVEPYSGRAAVSGEGLDDASLTRNEEAPVGQKSKVSVLRSA